MGADEYARRRAALLSTLGGGVLVVTGSPPPAHDYLPFAQDHDFRYLTGITEPGAAYIALKAGGRVEEFLFVSWIGSAVPCTSPCWRTAKRCVRRRRA
jgi:hypothetical protein